ncbi:hypothetical protein TRVL_02570 [Trypanosoma vivax]|nr:hypothetical protein TRVL_02570 [Trypanosoma vivax]
MHFSSRFRRYCMRLMSKPFCCLFLRPRRTSQPCSVLFSNSHRQSNLAQSQRHQSYFIATGPNLSCPSVCDLNPSPRFAAPYCVPTVFPSTALPVPCVASRRRVQFEITGKAHAQPFFCSLPSRSALPFTRLGQQPLSS